MTPLFSLRPARGSPSLIIGLLLLAGSLIALPLPAKTLRFASAFDPQSMDPHGLALQYQTRVVSQIYESLVSRDRNFAPEPALAMSWQHIDPKHWRFKLRPGVKFHDGTDFNADAVKFNLERYMTDPKSTRRNELGTVKSVEAVDPTPAGWAVLYAGVGGMAVRADLDRHRCRCRPNRERRAAGCADDVDELRLRMVSQGARPFDWWVG